VHLYTKNESPSFRTLDHQNNYLEEQRERSMKVAVQQEDLQLLAKTLQEQLLARVPSGQVFQVKCVVNNDELMILTQHPVGVKVDSETVFQLLEEVLQSWPNCWDQPVQCFLRFSGEKRPYAKSLLTLNQGGRGEKGGEGELETPTVWELDEKNEVDARDVFTTFADIPSTFAPADQPIDETSLIDESDSPLESEEGQGFDPLADGRDLLASKSARPIKPILLGVALVGIILLSGGAYLITRPCTMSECKEIQTAKKIKIESRQLIHRAKSDKELLMVQQQLETASLSLTNIPSWSPRNQEKEELKASFYEQSEKIDQVVKSLQAASLAMQKTQTPAKSLEELQGRQNLWRKAVAPLEAINTNSELYGLVQPKLLIYRARLQNINQQLLTEERWLKKLNSAKAVAGVATNLETSAKSLKDWQKVQSTWQVAINALSIIPQTSSGYQPAQELLAEYKPKLAQVRDRATIEQLAAKTYQQAVGTANQAKMAEQNHQLPVAVVQWGQALQAAKQISRNSFYYNQAQSLVEPYSASLKKAQEKLQNTSSVQQTQADLKKTCISEIQICTFTVDSRAIIIQLTREYDQIRQSSLVDPNQQDASKSSDISNHWNNLQDALAIISDNANLSLFVYDSQGKPVYTRSRVG
jgi:hypothetical protein